MKKENSQQKVMTALSILIMLLLVAIDQLIKAVMIVWLKPQGSVVIIKNLLAFTYVENTGVAFSMLSGNRWLLVIIMSLAILAGLYVLLIRKIKSGIGQVCAVMLLAGGIGNVIDRIAYGAVVDFIEPLFVNFAVFNFADCLITTGAVALVVYLIYDMIRETKQKKELETQEEADA